MRCFVLIATLVFALVVDGATDAAADWTAASAAGLDEATPKEEAEIVQVLKSRRQNYAQFGPFESMLTSKCDGVGDCQSPDEPDGRMRLLYMLRKAEPPKSSEPHSLNMITNEPRMRPNSLRQLGVFVSALIEKCDKSCETGEPVYQCQCA